MFPARTVLLARCLWSVLALCLPCPRTVHAWTGSSTTNTPICNTGTPQTESQITADGTGGMYAAWMDNRAGTPGVDFQIYAQHVDVNGNMLWALNGVAVCPSDSRQFHPRITTTSTGDLLVCWAFDTGRLVRAQQLAAADGAAQWGATGADLGDWPAGGTDKDISVAADNHDGLVATWQFTTPSGPGARVQRVGPTGSVIWTAAGVPVPNAAGDPRHTTIAADRNGGAIVAWDAIVAGNSAVYAQRFGSTLGNPLWTPALGVPLTDKPGDHSLPVAAPDGNDGAYVAFRDGIADLVLRSVAMQHLSDTGVLLSSPASITVAAPGDKVSGSVLRIVEDGLGGAIVTYSYCTNSRGTCSNTDHLVFVQRVSGNSLLWGTPQGIQVSVNADFSEHADLAPDGAGGCNVAWDMSGDIWSQHVLPNGSLVSGSPVGLCTATGQQLEPRVATDGAAGALAIWTDNRPVPQPGPFRATAGAEGMYAQQVNREGVLGVVIPPLAVPPPRRFGALAVEGAWPNPATGPLALSFTLGSATPATLELADLAGRRLVHDDVTFYGPGHHLMLLGTSRRFSPGVYFARVTQDGQSASTTVVIAR